MIKILQVCSSKDKHHLKEQKYKKLRREGIRQEVYQQMSNATGKLRAVSWRGSREMVLRQKAPSTGPNLLRESDCFSLNRGVNRGKE